MGEAASITEGLEDDPNEPAVLSPAVRRALMVTLSVGSAAMLTVFAVVAALAMLG